MENILDQIARWYLMNSLTFAMKNTFVSSQTLNNWRRFTKQSWAFFAKKTGYLRSHRSFKRLSKVLIDLSRSCDVTLTNSCSLRNTGARRRLGGVQRRIKFTPGEKWAASRGTTFPGLGGDDLEEYRGLSCNVLRTGGRIIAAGRVG